MLSGLGEACGGERLVAVEVVVDTDELPLVDGEDVVELGSEFDALDLPEIGAWTPSTT